MLHLHITLSVPFSAKVQLRLHTIKVHTNLMMFSYSLSLPFDSLHFLYITEASTFAGEKVFGSFSREIMLSNIVLQNIRKPAIILQLHWQSLISHTVLYQMMKKNWYTEWLPDVLSRIPSL